MASLHALGWSPAIQCEQESISSSRARAGESFKMAWQEERRCHQETVEKFGAEKALLRKETTSEVAKARAAQARAEAAAATSARQLAALRTEHETLRQEHEAMQGEGQAHVRTLQRDLARLRAEKGALCEEFTQRLTNLGYVGTGGGSAGAARGRAGGGGTVQPPRDALLHAHRPRLHAAGVLSAGRAVLRRVVGDPAGGDAAEHGGGGECGRGGNIPIQ